MTSGISDPRVFSSRTIWLFPPVYLVHLLDERFWGPGTAVWFAERTGVHFTSEAWLLVNIPSFLLFTLAAWLTASRRWPEWVAVALSLHLLLHTAVRIAASSIFLEVSPGLVSGTALCLPLAIPVLVLGIRELPRPQLWRGLLVGVLTFQPFLHAVAMPFLPSGPAGVARPNLLLIVSDSLRADVLSCHGGRARTPNICSLAERGVLFERVYSNAPWTLPSTVSLFAGVHPTVHETDARDPDRPGRRFYHVPDEQLLLAEELAASGYRVVAFVENRVAAGANALQGFAEPQLPAASVRAAVRASTTFPERDARYTRLMPALATLLEPGPDPLALLVWIDDPHAAYAPPQPWLDDFSADGLPRPLDFYLGLGHVERPDEGLRKLKFFRRDLARGEVELLEALYRAEVESVDERVGYLLEALKKSGAAKDTYVLFTSDHGEAFGEHGHFLHGLRYHEEQVRVPLLVAGPDVRQGARIVGRVEHLDLVPTLAALLDVAVEAELPGRDLSDLLRNGREPDPGEPIYLAGAQGDRGDALIDGRHKLITHPRRGSRLFDLELDPEEQRDVSLEQPERVARLEERIAEIHLEDARRRGRRDVDAAREGALTDDTERLLRELGYVD